MVFFIFKIFEYFWHFIDKNNAATVPCHRLSCWLLFKMLGKTCRSKQQEEAPTDLHRKWRKGMYQFSCFFICKNSYKNWLLIFTTHSIRIPFDLQMIHSRGFVCKKSNQSRCREVMTYGGKINFGDVNEAVSGRGLKTNYFWTLKSIHKTINLDAFWFWMQTTLIPFRASAYQYSVNDAH